MNTDGIYELLPELATHATLYSASSEHPYDHRHIMLSVVGFQKTRQSYIYTIILCRLRVSSLPLTHMLAYKNSTRGRDKLKIDLVLFENTGKEKPTIFAIFLEKRILQLNPSKEHVNNRNYEMS